MKKNKPQKRSDSLEAAKLLIRKAKVNKLIGKLHQQEKTEEIITKGF